MLSIKWRGDFISAVRVEFLISDGELIYVLANGIVLGVFAKERDGNEASRRVCARARVCVRGRWKLALRNVQLELKSPSRTPWEPWRLTVFGHFGDFYTVSTDGGFSRGISLKAITTRPGSGWFCDSITSQSCFSRLSDSHSVSAVRKWTWQQHSTVLNLLKDLLLSPCV